VLVAERAHPLNVRAEGPRDRRDPRRRPHRDRRITLLLAFVAATLAVMASVHLAGLLRGSKPFRPDEAGIAEAVIGAVLLVGAAAVWRRAAHHWGVAVAATSFAILGFVVGLSFTLRGGDAIDIAYHATVLPLLLLALILLLRRKERSW
jgi:O-antigen/teichoic acid export membrane protein